MNSSRRLILLRHGETDWNSARRMQGQTDVPLNNRGLEQAKAAVHGIAPLKPTFLISSDLSRAVATVIPLATACKLPIHLDVRLREIAVGTWEGVHVDEAEAKFPEEYALWRGGEDIPRGGGETRAETAIRMAEAVTEIVQRPDVGDTIVVASHGVSLRVGLDLLQENGLVDLGGPAPHFENAQWLEVEIAAPAARR